MIDLVCGGQAGDEGKGKIAAYLSYKGNYSYCVRVGGPNAGHTVEQDGHKYTLKNIPSGFLNPNTKLVLGAGAYTKTDWLLKEVELTNTTDRLIIDPYAVLITDEETKAEQDAAHFMKHIGSVGTGLGQAVKNRIERRQVKFAKDFLTKYYVRLSVKDATGVLSKIAGLFSKHNVSISEVKQVSLDGGEAQIIVITHLASESHVKKLLAKLSSLEEVYAVKGAIRIED